MQQPDSSLERNDVEAVAWLLEQMAADAGEVVDRPRVRRALEEAAATWPPGPQGAWWRWLIESTQSLGLRCKIVDCSFEQLAAIAREGGRIVTCVGDEGCWTSVSVSRGGRFQVLRSLRGQNRARVRKRKLRELLQSEGDQDVLRCLVVEPRLADSEQLDPDSLRRSPLARLLALIRPESQDLWIIFVFALVNGLLALATPLAVEQLVTTVAFGQLLQPVVILALMLFAFLAFSATLRALQTFAVEIIQRRMFARVAADLAYRLPRARFDVVADGESRELVNRFFDIVTVQKVTAQLLLDGISLVLGAIIGMAVLAFYHPWLLGFDVLLIALIAFVIFVLGRGAVATSIKESKTKYQMAAWLEELMGCPIAFRHGGAAEFALDRGDRLIYDYLVARRRHFRVLMRQIVFALGMQAFASTALLGLGGWLVIAGQLTLGQLVAAELIVTVIVGSFAKLGKHMESYYDVLAAVDKLGVLFDLPVEPQDGLLSFSAGQAPIASVRRVQCEAPHGESLQDGVTFSLRQGDRLVVSGPSGSGKSLLLDLLFGLRVPTAGHVSICGVDPTDLRPDVLRSFVALVRDVEVFAGTVAENVHLERPEASTSDVRDALERVGLTREVLALPDGLDTKLAPGGFPLTPNQCRKLMLARAIVVRPSLLLIDGVIDALSDEEAERLLQMLGDPAQPWTLVLVTGRRLPSSLSIRTLELRGGLEENPREDVHA